MTTIRFIAGSGRSGTTWIQDALASANRLRPVFEPLHPYLSPIGDRYAYRMIPAEESHPELKAFLVTVSQGRELRIWTQYRQQWRWLFPPAAQFMTKRHAGTIGRHWAKLLREFPRMARDGLRKQPLVKCIRANLMLPWIVRNLECHAVLILRHPGAVVESELRSGWNASYVLARFRNDRGLSEQSQGRYADLLGRPLSTTQALALRWVIENQCATEAAHGAGIPVFHYERLQSSNRAEWSRLCTALKLSTPPDGGLLVRPSQQSAIRRNHISDDDAMTPKWMTRLSKSDGQQIQSMLDEVHFSQYSMMSPMPDMATTPRPAEM